MEANYQKRLHGLLECMDNVQVILLNIKKQKKNNAVEVRGRMAYDLNEWRREAVAVPSSSADHF